MLLLAASLPLAYSPLDCFSSIMPSCPEARQVWPEIYLYGELRKNFFPLTCGC